jgi:hypothetical protein
MKKSEIRKYAVEWEEETGLYYVPRGEMPTKVPKGCSLFTIKLRTQFIHDRESMVFEHGFKSRATAN